MCSDDRISDLHDSILSHILSFLTTKEAVVTSILCQRWRFIWTKVPVIDLDGEGIQDEDVEHIIQYQNLIKTVLFHNKESLRSCRLTVPFGTDPQCANAWIEDIVKRDVNEIELEFIDSVKLLSLSFTSQKLVVLTLKSCQVYFGPMPPTHFPPYLRVMNFYGINLTCGLISLLTSSCLVLQELSIDDCEVSDASETLYVHSSTLKKLCMKENMRSEDGVLDIIIEAPSVEYLTLWDVCPSDSCRYYVSDLSCLREADVYLPMLCYNLKDPVIRKNNLKLVNNLTSSSTLRLRDTEFQRIPNFIRHQYPTFNNLTCLELEIHESCWCILPAVMKHSPNLVHLTVACASIGYLRESICPHAIYGVPRCLLFSVKVIEIRDFIDSDGAAEMLSYLLIMAKVLKEIKIYCVESADIPSPMEIEFIRQLCYDLGGSGTSRISICSSS